MNDTINKDTLKPGDMVGIKVPTRIGWGFFRYPKLLIMTIKRITPARTKFIMTNGAEFNKHEPFYPITEEAQRKSNVAICAETISACLNKLDNLQRNGKLFSVDDIIIEHAADLLSKICDEVC